jgi:hypothetical protein
MLNMTTRMQTPPKKSKSQSVSRCRHEAIQESKEGRREVNVADTYSAAVPAAYPIQCSSEKASVPTLRMTRGKAREAKRGNRSEGKRNEGKRGEGEKKGESSERQARRRE